MQRSLSLTSWGLAAAALVFTMGACGGDDDPERLPPLFEPEPECQGDAVAPLQGQQQSVISALEIGDRDDGFDLDGDGMPDNKLAGVGAVAREPIEDAINEYDILIPIEFFDTPSPAADTCVKFALYLGVYKFDADGDGEDTAVDGGDCNDDNLMVPGIETPGNRIDDDCDGLADEQNDGPNQEPSADTADMDSDGRSPNTGDCDDTNDAVGGLVGGNAAVEICGDGFDNDCDGVADRTVNGVGEVTACNPYDATPDTIDIDPRSFDGAGAPIITFLSGEITATPTGLQLTAGPSLFQVSIPVIDDLELTLKITGATIEADVIMVDGRMALANGRLGGVIDARTADTIRGLEVEEIMLTPEQSLADAVFANVLGNLLAIESDADENSPHFGCRKPDIDVDRDGQELFCDKNRDGDTATKVVDTCVDGDGTVIEDTVVGGNVVHCTEAVDDEGFVRFPDGISVELNFSTSPANLVRP